MMTTEQQEIQKLRDDLARVTAERDEARDRLIEVVPVLNRVIEERDAALATAERFAKCVDAVAPLAAPAPTPADAKEAPAAVPGLVFGEPDAEGETRDCPDCNGTTFTASGNDCATCDGTGVRAGFAPKTAHNAARLKGAR